jgi:hypothetical protein
VGRIGPGLLALSLCAAVAGCGGGGGETSSAGPLATTAPASGGAVTRTPAQRHFARTCRSLAAGGADRALARAGVRAGRLRLRSIGVGQPAQCVLGAPGASVEVDLDSAPQAARRYFNRITESIQTGLERPSLRPQAVAGVGEGHVPGGGANWIPASEQLLSLRGQRLLIAAVHARGGAESGLRQAAARISVAVWRGVRRRFSG